MNQIRHIINGESVPSQSGRTFVSENPDDHLDDSDVALARLLLQTDQFERQLWIEAEFKHIERCRVAAELQAAPIPALAGSSCLSSDRFGRT